ncbi:hypothetical protein HYFRA_00010879 [Hymenoscyphus fraxineus]|uniref:Uncharacterized protein n=1 Tax=Hymenoscyphus fraxineus TaxID=746836 RepID=A0A9N9PSY2_9HELO|nr:hypothetical protein HYFRA_00010879 [Hymenoscyphus fraxineus]
MLNAITLPLKPSFVDGTTRDYSNAWCYISFNSASNVGFERANQTRQANTLFISEHGQYLMIMTAMQKR